MNKILATIWLFAAAMCFTACESEDPLQPSNADTNPFITDDNADDEESLLRKEFYSKNSCYLLFNDTLNTGELLDIGYMMTASQNNNAYKYDYLTTIEEKHLATQFVEQYLLPHLGKKLRPFSSFLSITSTTSPMKMANYGSLTMESQIHRLSWVSELLP